MRAATTRWLLLAASCAAIGCGALGLLVPLARLERPAPASALEGVQRRAGSPAPIDSLAQVVVSRTPFRSARRPAAPPFDTTISINPASSSPTPKPVLTLSGMVWGVEPAAIVEGLPGIERPRVIRRGETVGGIKVTRLERGRVWLAGLDTAWTLRIKDTR